MESQGTRSNQFVGYSASSNHQHSLALTPHAMSSIHLRGIYMKQSTVDMTVSRQSSTQYSTNTTGVLPLRYVFKCMLPQDMCNFIWRVINICWKLLGNRSGCYSIEIFSVLTSTIVAAPVLAMRHCNYVLANASPVHGVSKLTAC